LCDVKCRSQLAGCPSGTPVPPGPCNPGSNVAPPAGVLCSHACPTAGPCRACCANSGLTGRRLTVCEDGCPATGIGSITPASPEQIAQVYAAIPNSYLIRIQAAELGIELQGFLESMSSEENQVLLKQLARMNNNSWKDLQYLVDLGLPHFVQLVKIGLNGESLDNNQARFQLYQYWINQFMADGSDAQINSLSAFLS